MTSPSVTIGVTSYNAENTIRAALESAFGQTMPIKQIVVVDDCSTDSTMSILREYADRPGFEIHQNTTNSGVAVSRNEIVKRARGEFIVFFDDDDVSEQERVAAQINRILEYEAEFAHGAPVVCHTARLQKYPNGSERVEPTMGQIEGKRAPHGSAVARRTLLGEPLEDAYGSCATCSQAARTETYRGLGGFDNRFRRCQDFEFAIRAALAGGHFIGIPEPLVTQNMTATSEKNLDNLRKFTFLALEKHRSVFGPEKVYKFCRSWIELKFDWLAGRYVKFSVRLPRVMLLHPVMTWRRIRMALPNLGYHHIFRKFSRKLN
jgi:glycosyltransferase involved in cell wall biosynthesis